MRHWLLLGTAALAVGGWLVARRRDGDVETRTRERLRPLPDAPSARDSRTG